MQRPKVQDSPLLSASPVLIVITWARLSYSTVVPGHHRDWSLNACPAILLIHETYVLIFILPGLR